MEERRFHHAYRMVWHSILPRGKVVARWTNLAFFSTGGNLLFVFVAFRNLLETTADALNFFHVLQTEARKNR
jgi:hypothetical protein